MARTTPDQAPPPIPATDLASLVDSHIAELIELATKKTRVKTRATLHALRPLLEVLARALYLRLALFESPSYFECEHEGTVVASALALRAGPDGALGELLARRPWLLRNFGQGIALPVARLVRENSPGPQRTPGTRLTWSTLGEWLAARNQIRNRPPSSAKNRAEAEHALALTQAIVNTGTTEALAALKQIANWEKVPLWHDWIHLASQDISGRTRALARTLRKVAERGLPGEVSCAQLEALGFASATSAAHLGAKKADDLQRLLSPDLHVTFDAARCTFRLVEAKGCSCTRCASARPA